MVANGEDKPIWFTEFGWSTTSGNCGVSEATQADYLTKALRFVEQDAYVQVALWYNFRNNYWDHDSDTIEARYGLLRTDFSQKPAYQAFKSYAPGAAATTSPSTSGATKKKSTRTTLTLKKGASASASRHTKSAHRKHS